MFRKSLSNFNYLTHFIFEIKTEFEHISWNRLLLKFKHRIGYRYQLISSRQTSDRAEDHQVCFHRHLSDHVNPWRSTVGCMVPLGCTNKAACGVKLLPATVLSWHVHCGCFCALLNTQRLLPCASGWFNPPSASHPPPTPTPPPSCPPTPYRINPWYWWSSEKSVSKSSSIS